MRKIYDVVDRMIPLIPKEESALLGELHSLRQSALYSAPEMDRVWWSEFSAIINTHIPPSSLPLSGWQASVVNIFMDKA